MTTIEGVGGETLVLEAFLRLRRRGFNLGIDEYLAGLSLISAGAAPLPYGQSLATLQQGLKMLWCTSRSEQGQFDGIWEQALSAIAASPQVTIEDIAPQNPTPPPPVWPEQSPWSSPPVSADSTQGRDPQPALGDLTPAPQPVRAPFTPAEVDHSGDLQHYWPVSRRSMSYSWRYLRRIVPAGVPEVLDIAATVRQTAEQGFYLQPIFTQRDYNRAELLLLIDQKGSMMPLHPFTREVADTARYESGLPPEQVTVGYFQNVPGEFLYRDSFLTEPIERQTLLGRCNANTSVLIVSDAGAARGYRQLDRIRTTIDFLSELRRITQLYAWLNPLPVDRWSGSSAEMIARLIPMFQMDQEGLSRAVDVVRGLGLPRLRP